MLSNRNPKAREWKVWSWLWCPDGAHEKASSSHCMTQGVAFEVLSMLFHQVCHVVSSVFSVFSHELFENEASGLFASAGQFEPLAWALNVSRTSASKSRRWVPSSCDETGQNELYAASVGVCHLRGSHPPVQQLSAALKPGLSPHPKEHPLPEDKPDDETSAGLLFGILEAHCWQGRAEQGWWKPQQHQSTSTRRLASAHSASTWLYTRPWAKSWTQTI